LQGLSSIGESALNQSAKVQRLYAQWLSETGRPAAALPHLELAIADMSRARRPGHYAVLIMQRDKATLLARLGQSVVSQALMQATHAQAVAELGEDHPISFSILQASAASSSR
jgi:hypothetical protein